jgi:hypothetical protein
MKYYFKALTFLSVLALVACKPKPEPEILYLSKQFKIPDGASVVISWPAQSAVGIVGPINSNTLASYRETESKYEVKKLYIDSGGGDVPSAIAIADELRQHNTRLIVQGRCFSACANYIFTGAPHKDVLPGSLIAIHSSQVSYYLKDSVRTVVLRHMDQLAYLDSDGHFQKQFDASAKLEEHFFSKVGISKVNFQIFEGYQSRREQATSKKDSTCRQIDWWTLSRKELDAMGVKGIGIMWMPDSAKEAAVAAKALGLNPATNYFGSGQALSEACKNS